MPGGRPEDATIVPGEGTNLPWPSPPRGLLRRVRLSWPFDWLDLIALMGLLLVGGSLALVWVPLAGLVVGVLLMVYAFLAALPPRGGG